MKLHRTTECPVCGRLAMAYEPGSSWCRDCTVALLVEQEREATDFRQERQVVEQLRVVEEDE